MCDKTRKAAARQFTTRQMTAVETSASSQNEVDHQHQGMRTTERVQITTGRYLSCLDQVATGQPD